MNTKSLIAGVVFGVLITLAITQCENKDDTISKDIHQKVDSIRGLGCDTADIGDYEDESDCLDKDKEYYQPDVDIEDVRNYRWGTL